MSVARQQFVEEPEVYPDHEEDSVPQHPEHEYQVWALRGMLRRALPHHWVTGNICMYWIRGDTETYVAPDVLVVQGTERGAEEGAYRSWCDPPALLVVEISSKSTVKDDEFIKPETLLINLGVSEYLFFDRLRPRLRLWRSRQGRVVEVRPNPDGRFPCESVGVEFGVVDGVIRVFEPDGRMLPTPREAEKLADQALADLDQERERAAALEHELERLREELRRRETTRLDAAD